MQILPGYWCEHVVVLCWSGLVSDRVCVSLCVFFRRITCVPPSSSSMRLTVWLRCAPADRTTSTGRNKPPPQDEVTGGKLTHLYTLVMSILQLHRIHTPGSDGRLGRPRRGRCDRSHKPLGRHRPGATSAWTLRQGVPVWTS